MRGAILIMVGSGLLGGCSSEPPETFAETTYTPLAGSNLALAGGMTVPIISVGQFDQDTASHAGRIAIEGRVSESYADRSTFILVDCTNMEGCAKACCPQATVPVRLADSEYAGDLPQPDDFVIVIGTLTLTETGYKLEVDEVRRKAETLMRRTSSDT